MRRRDFIKVVAGSASFWPLAARAERGAKPSPQVSDWARDFVTAGGLMRYGTDLADMFRQVGVYTGRVLKGENARRVASAAVDEIRVRHQPSNGARARH